MTDPFDNGLRADPDGRLTQGHARAEAARPLRPETVARIQHGMDTHNRRRGHRARGALVPVACCVLSIVLGLAGITAVALGARVLGLVLLGGAAVAPVVAVAVAARQHRALIRRGQP